MGLLNFRVLCGLKTLVQLMNLRMLIVSCVLLASMSADATSEFEQWMLQQQQGIQQQKTEFQEYKDKRDKEFTAFLKKQWKGMDLLKGIVRDEKPKPVKMPIAKPKPIPKPSPVPKDKPVDKPVSKKPAPRPEPVVIPPPPVVKPPVPIKPVPVPVPVQKGERARVNFFGQRITFYYDPAFRRSLPRKLDEKAVSNFWSELSRADFEPLLDQVSKQATALQLNDWGYAVLTNELAEQIYQGDSNRRALFTWFIMTKAGFKTRIAYDDRNVYLLVPSKHAMYEVPYFTFDRVRYYAIDFDGNTKKLGRVYTSDGHYPGADKKLDMTIRTKASKGLHANKRTLSFVYQDKRYTIEADYEKSRVDYLNTYPQLDLELYFDSMVGETTASPLLKQLADAMQDMDEQEAVNFLLRFVQTSLKYKTDEGQFGRENYLFPEETIYYPYSDCEDRSVLFAWLVRRLLGLEVIGLNYPGHVATAVHMKQHTGDYVIYKGKRYTVADPTYINAFAGMTMPDYKNTKPGVILIQ